MNRSLASVAIGACAAGTAYAALRLIAPFSGLGLSLLLFVVVSTLAAFAAGCALASGPRATGSGGPIAARALFAAALSTLLVVWLRTALLVALDRADLFVASAVAALAFTGLPCVLLGVAFAAAQSGADAAATLRGIALALLGAALAAPFVALVLVPGPGVRLTLLGVAVAEAAVAALLGARRTPVPATAGLLLVLGGTAAVAASGAAAPSNAAALVAYREAATAELRVLDREGARYLLADGTIHTVIDTLSGDCIHRGPAALELLKLIRPGRDSMLVLGLRGGAVPLSFARSGWRVRVVDPDSDAVAVSRRLSYKPGEMLLHPGDARRFVRRDINRYSVVVVDAFEGSALPFTLCTREFFTELATRVAPGGLVVLVLESRGWHDPLVASFAATLRTSFPHVLALPTNEPPSALGTVLLVGSREPVEFAEEALPDPTTYFLNPDALWGAQQVTHAWLNRFEPATEGAVVFSDDRTAVDLMSDQLNRAARAELHAFFGRTGGSW